jgi:signal transduction histidine kinase
MSSVYEHTINDLTGKPFDLAGLAGRVRTVDGRLQISSPPGGPTVIAVELPSHA